MLPPLESLNSWSAKHANCTISNHASCSENLRGAVHSSLSKNFLASLIYRLLIVGSVKVFCYNLDKLLKAVEDAILVAIGLN